MRRASDALDRARGLAERQQGRVSRAQLLAANVPEWWIQSWVERGWLCPVLPGVYAVGHRAQSREADLWAAVLYAGPGAAISHVTAAQWRGLIDHPGDVIEVSTPRKVHSLPGVRVYGRRDVVREMWRGLPVVDVGQTLISLADAGTHQLVRRALSVLDYRDELDFAALMKECGRGRRGAAALRKALAAHDPMLARANEGIEQRFLDLCRKWRLPTPEMNVWVHEVLVDAFWAEAGLVVEFDGLKNHSSAAQLRRDHMNDLVLRSHGLQVRRYDTVLLRTRAALVRRELEEAIVGRKRDSGVIR